MKQLVLVTLLFCSSLCFAQQQSKPAKADAPKEIQWQYLKLSLWETGEKGEPINDDRRKENIALLLEQLKEAEVKDELLLKQFDDKMKTTQALNVLGRVGWELFNVSQETTPEFAVRYTYFLRKVKNP